MNHVDIVLRLCARHYGVSRAAMLGKSRAKSLVAARHEAMRLARACLGMSFPEIGREFQRDHTTVMHAYQRASERPNAALEQMVRAEVQAVIEMAAMRDFQFNGFLPQPSNGNNEPYQTARTCPLVGPMRKASHHRKAPQDF